MGFTINTFVFEFTTRTVLFDVPVNPKLLIVCRSVAGGMSSHQQVPSLTRKKLSSVLVLLLYPPHDRRRIILCFEAIARTAGLVVRSFALAHSGTDETTADATVLAPSGRLLSCPSMLDPLPSPVGANGSDASVELGQELGSWTLCYGSRAVGSSVNMFCGRAHLPRICRWLAMLMPT